MSIQAQEPFNSQQMQPLTSNNSSVPANETQNEKITKENRYQKDDEKERKGIEKEKNSKDSKSETNSDELDSMPDDELATNEQTQPSSKHIENDFEEKANTVKTKESNGKNGKSKSNLETYEDNSESGVSGSGQSIINDRRKAAVLLRNKEAISRDSIFKEKPGKLRSLIERFHNTNYDNENVPSSSEAANEAQEQEDFASGEIVEASGSSGDDASGIKKSKNDEETGSETKNEKSEKEENKKVGGKATEQEKTENAEKYEDEEKKEENKSKKPVQQKKKNLMESMLENGSLKAVSVTKGKTREKVPVHFNKETENESDDDEEEDATNIDLDLKEAGLQQFSGSGNDDGKFSLTLF